MSDMLKKFSTSLGETYVMLEMIFFSQMNNRRQIIDKRILLTDKHIAFRLHSVIMTRRPFDFASITLFVSFTKALCSQGNKN